MTISERSSSGGTGGRAKCWPLERFAALARRSRRPAAFVVGPAEVERWPRDRLAALAGEFPTLTGPTLPVLAGLAGDAGTWVGNDSGPTHLAAALGAPTVALFGPTAPERFAPRGRRVAVLRARPLTELTVGR
ncbi:MAG: glycosyltransferase family 9 protein, partial [Planctomycetota bacterium]